MSRTRFLGNRSRRRVLRERQMAFLSVLVECCGCRARAIEASGLPLGTVLRWNSDPWFRERYEEVRETLTRDEKALRENLMAKSFAMALGKYDGLLKPAAVRRIVDGIDEGRAQAASSAELERQIRELLRG